MDKNTLPLILVEASEQDIASLCGWFVSFDEIRDWGGPNISFPISSRSLIVETKLAQGRSYKLIDTKNNMLAFGQCYERLGRCHLARLVVNPQNRGCGVGKQLVKQLLTQAPEYLVTKGFSLFVWPHNKVAKKLYQSLGFRRVNYPESITPEMAKCDYLIKD
ncbi:GNAT family N-acetyltransferase [Aliiglaciecola sp. SL4]|uniref:GNAT family N-acetyltransferase n=1 Tax=Alteromonadaceae TaxID=72275 RepID=UPI001C0A4833|nr:MULTISPECIES: GNAT family N-acetyltransferase [Aliiglaciecola]MBU2878659.1 GNAT family N-acetyltransferase [Aliiglaciecola lipolytica]MDO6709512.1 GNAT family N-acetyltransferase [Aliiglaciecola sp. 2_MG-2023]MDO6750946.1 GNAT family N-acetyltransferase [Aliiglaciecola sp. 1_MG-2023]